MVYFSWRPIRLLWGSAVDVVYFAVDRGYFVCCEECAEYCADDCVGEISIGGVKGDKGGTV